MNILICIEYGANNYLVDNQGNCSTPEKAINFATVDDAIKYLLNFSQKFQGTFEIKTLYTWFPVQPPITVK